jgi:photosystem II stability/assembly factor-like uncharacterized protein
MNRIILILAVILTTIPLLATEWIEVAPPEGANGGLSYQFISATEGWAFSSNYDGTLLYHTNNTGQSWEQIYVSDQNQIIDLQMIDSQHGWAIIYRGMSVDLFTTASGGEAWFRVDVQVPISGLVTTMDFSDMENGLIAGYSDGVKYVYRTTNGGYDFEELYQTDINFVITDISCLGEDNIWVLGTTSEGIAFYSSNAGADWVILGDTLSHANTLNYNFFSDQVYGILGDFTIYEDIIFYALILTNDGMDTYTLYDDSTFGEYVYSCYFMDEQTIWVGGRFNMFISTNGGRSFAVYQNFDTQIKDITFIDSTGFATGGNGSLYVYHPAVSNNDSEQILGNGYQLTNYPNPFNPQTTISFAIEKAEIVKLEIFNSKGQRVKTLLKSRLQPGKHIYVWDGTDNHNNKVSSGVYFYRLEVAGEKHIKQCILLK